MFKLMLLKLPARFCPLAERLGTSQDRNITSTKELIPFPDYFFLCDYGSVKETNWLMSKGMSLPLSDVFNGCSLVKRHYLTTATLISSCHWKTLFACGKKRPVLTLTLTINYCKIVQKNKLAHPKQQ